MKSVVSSDPLFMARTTQSLTARDIAAVMSGRIAALRVPAMLGEDSCTAALRSLEDADFDTYDPMRVVPRVAKFGPAVNDFRVDGSIHPSYWDSAERAWDAWSKLAWSVDPITCCVDTLANAWPNGVTVAAPSGRRMFAGVIREINLGLQVHFDDVAREYTRTPLGEEIVAQLAFNLYLHVPASGGETIIWRKRWHPQDEQWSVPNGYGYDSAIVDGVDRLALAPRTGEAFLFDPRNYHTVLTAHPERRISLGFFAALTVAGRLLLWS